MTITFSALETVRYECLENLIEKSHTPGVGWELFKADKYIGNCKTLRETAALANQVNDLTKKDQSN